MRTAVGLRIDAGVSTAKIEKLINRFSAGQPRQSTENVLPWLGARGIPQDRREELLQELAGLPSEPEHSPADTRRTMSAN
ncbi:MAG TPA: hypothetical protein VNF04_11745, partial [Stellaceae bacterium]|nr:hypothetical protein [Stellaceae bacterium]